MRSHCACSCRDNVGHFKEVCTENEVEMQAVRLAILTRATDVRGFAYGVIFCCAELEKTSRSRSQVSVRISQGSVSSTPAPRISHRPQELAEDLASLR